MKRLKLIAATLVVTGLAAIPAMAFNGQGGRPVHVAGTCLSTTETELVALTDAEIATLKRMREEEKLARDIYLELNAFWPAAIFTQIAESEQRHFDAIGRKLELYGIDDPALPDIGVFADPALQALHDGLLALGLPSYVDALKVGVKVEEQDIVDLQIAIDGTASVPLTVTYTHLLKASENHLSSFVKLLQDEGVVYEP